MSDLLSKLKLGTNNTKLINWPGTETKVLLRILSQQDFQTASIDTERIFKAYKSDLNLMNGTTYAEEENTQILFLALRDPANVSEPIAPSITEFRKSLSTNEKRLLFEEYASFDAECNPSPGNLSDEEFDRLVVSLKKKPEETLTSLLSLSIAKKLLLILAKAPMNLPADNS
jgi:hypothetical protein